MKHFIVRPVGENVHIVMEDEVMQRRTIISLTQNEFDDLFYRMKHMREHPSYETKLSKSFSQPVILEDTDDSLSKPTLRIVD